MKRSRNKLQITEAPPVRLLIKEWWLKKKMDTVIQWSAMGCGHLRQPEERHEVQDKGWENSGLVFAAYIVRNALDTQV